MLGMRVVCSFVGGAGHLVPQLPLHRALHDAGHDLVLVGRASATKAAPSRLYRHLETHEDRRNGVAATISPLVAVDVEHELAVIGDYFAGPAARKKAAEVGSVLSGADLLVCDELDFGAMAAAQKARVPVVVVAVIASGALVRPERFSDALEHLRQSVSGSAPIRLRGDFFVVPFDPSMRDPGFPPPSDALWMRPDAGPDPRPNGSVVATLGTEFNTESGDLFGRMLSALAGIDEQATVAVGRDLDPARFGPQPPHVSVAQHVDFDEVLPRASVVLHHGGSGLFVRSVLGGVPQIVFPMGADQPFTAYQVERLGLGRVLDPLTATRSTIGQTLLDVRSDGAVRQRVLALRQSLLTLPDAAAIVTSLEATLAH